MGSDKSKKKTTLDWVLIVVIVAAVAVGGYFLYQNVIKYMIWPEKPPTGEFRVVTPPGGQPMLVPVSTSIPRAPSVSSFEAISGAGGELEDFGDLF